MEVNAQRTHVLVLGSRSAIGRRFIDSLEASNLEPIAVSSQVCDLLDSASVDKLIEQLHPRAARIRFAVQFSTTYGADDMLMARNVARIIDTLSVPRLVFISSWVVLLDKSLTSTVYIDTKRKCEAFYRDTWHDDPSRLRIVRPSVVIGDKHLMHQRLLDALAYVPFLIPRQLARCFVDVEDVVKCIGDVGTHEGEGLRTHCVLGPLRSLREACGADQASGLVAGILHLVFAPTRYCLYLLFVALAAACAYFRGWLALIVTPTTEEDVLALACPHNLGNVQVLGRGAIYKYYKQRFPGKLLMNLRNHRGVVRLSKTSVVVRSGTVFADLLHDLMPTRRTLLVHPNYKYITAGAAVMVPVHGSSLKHPLVNNCILSITYLSNGRILTRRSPQGDGPRSVSAATSGRIDVVLEVELALSPLDTATQTYKQSKRVLDRGMRGKDILELLDGAVANAELRMNVPQMREPWQLYTYTVAEAREGDGFRLPQNWVGKLWDPILKDGNGLLSKLGLEAYVVSWIDNYEIFLEKEDYERFADEYADSAHKWPFFKVLVRKCCSQSYFGHSRPLYAIDIAILHTARNLQLSIDIFSKYKSAQLHPSKYVGPLSPAIPVMQCA